MSQRISSVKSTSMSNVKPEPKEPQSPISYFADIPSIASDYFMDENHDQQLDWDSGSDSSDFDMKSDSDEDFSFSKQAKPVGKGIKKGKKSSKDENSIERKKNSGKNRLESKQNDSKNSTNPLENEESSGKNQQNETPVDHKQIKMEVDITPYECQEESTSTTSNNPQKSKDSKTNVCKICDKTFATRGAIQIHLNVVHDMDNKVYECRHCKKIFKHHSYVGRHINRFHQMTYQKHRDVVVKLIRGKKDLIQPEPESQPEVMENSDSNSCKKCGRNFTSTRYLNDHMKVAHGTDRRVFVCTICEKRFKLKDYLRRHILKRHNQPLTNQNHFVTKEDEPEEIDQEIVDVAKPNFKVKGTSCRECGQKFCSFQALKDHMKIKHKIDDRIFVCKFCHMEFEVVSYLKRHTKKAHSHSVKPHEVIVRRENERRMWKRVRVKKPIDQEKVAEEA